MQKHCSIAHLEIINHLWWNMPCLLFRPFPNTGRVGMDYSATLRQTQRRVWRTLTHSSFVWRGSGRWPGRNAWKKKTCIVSCIVLISIRTHYRLWPKGNSCVFSEEQIKWQIQFPVFQPLFLPLGQIISTTILHCMWHIFTNAIFLMVELMKMVQSQWKL